LQLGAVTHVEASGWLVPHAVVHSESAKNDSSGDEQAPPGEHEQAEHVVAPASASKPPCPWKAGALT
jgi:hypothetical protein